MELPKKHYRKLIKILPILGAVALVFGVFLNVKADDDPANPLVETIYESSNTFNMKEIKDLVPISEYGSNNEYDPNHDYMVAGSAMIDSKIRAAVKIIDKDGNEGLIGHTSGGDETNFRTARYESVVEVSDGVYVAVGEVVDKLSSTSSVDGGLTDAVFSKFEIINGEMVKTQDWIYSSEPVYAITSSTTEYYYGTKFSKVLLDDDGNLIVSGIYIDGEKKYPVSFVWKIDIDSTPDCTIERNGEVLGQTICEEDLIWKLEVEAINDKAIKSAQKSIIQKTGSNSGEFLLMTGLVGTIGGQSTGASGPLIAKIEESNDLTSAEIVWAQFESRDSAKYIDFISSDGKNFFILDDSSVGGNVEKRVLSEDTTVAVGSSIGGFYNSLESTIDGETLFIGHYFGLRKYDDLGNLIWSAGEDNGKYFTAAVNKDGTIVADHSSGSSSTFTLQMFRDNTFYYHINYHLIDGSQIPTSLVLNRDRALAGQPFTPTDYDTFNSYVLNGWYTDPELTTKFEDYDEPATHDIDLYGEYLTPRYVSVTYRDYCTDLGNGIYNPSVKVGNGQTINGLLPSYNDNGGTCVLDDLRYSNGNPFDINTPITEDISLEADLVPAYLLIHNDEISFQDGSEFNIEEAEGISWEPSNEEEDVLTLNGWSSYNIKIDNGSTPISLVIEGENAANIKSINTPIVVSGTGSLRESDIPFSSSYTINVVGSTLTVNSGTFRSHDDLNADSIVVNGGTVPYLRSNIITVNDGVMLNSIFTGSQWGSYNDMTEKVVRIEINGGSFYDSGDEIESYVPGDLIINGGTIILSDIIVNGDITINGGTVIVNSSYYGFGVMSNDQFNSDGNGGNNGGKITLNGGNLTVSPEGLIGGKGFIMNGGTANLKGILATNYVVLNDGELNITNSENSSYTQYPILISNGWAIFNGGKATIKGSSPAMISYPGSLSEDMATLLETDLDINVEDLATDSGMIFNGGDITFQKPTISDVVDSMVGGVDAEINAMISQMGEEEVAETCSGDGMIEESATMFGAFKTWKLNDVSPVLDGNGDQVTDGNGNALVTYTTVDEEGAETEHEATLVPMLDENDEQIMLPELDLNTGEMALDGDGNPIFIALYKVVDSEENVIYDRVGQMTDANGNIVYFKAGFSDTTDCMDNFLTVYPDFMRAYYRFMYEGEVASSFSPQPILVEVFKKDSENPDNAANDPSIFIKNNLIKDPENLSVRIANITIDDGTVPANTIGAGTMPAATFGDNEEGEAVFAVSQGNNDEVVYTTEHILTDYAHIYEDQGRTITWQNEDGTVLETDENVALGTLPTYDGETPIKAATAQYSYTFSGWTPEIEEVSGDQTYTATFSETVNKYTVTFVDDDDTVIKAATEYDYGTQAADIEKPADPTKEATAEYTYTFSGWTPEIAEVTENATYKATYSSTKNSYTITFANEDGSNPWAREIEYGEEVSIPQTNPTKETTPKYQYEFVGWTDGENTYASDEIPNASGDVTYTPVFNQQPYDIEYAWYEDKDIYEIGANDDELALVIDVNVNYFNHVVKVDGEAITEDTDYVITSGSTIVTLQDSYLDSLSVGPHIIDVYFDEPTEDEDVVVPSVFAVTRSGNNDDPDDPGNMGNPDDPGTPHSPAGNTGGPEDQPSVPSSDGGPTDSKPGAGNHGFGYFSSSAAIATISLALVASLAGAFTYKKIKSRK